MAGLLAQAYTESATSRLHSVFMQIPSLYSGGTAGASTPFPWHGQPILRTREGVVKSILCCILLLLCISCFVTVPASTNPLVSMFFIGVTIQGSVSDS